MRMTLRGLEGRFDRTKTSGAGRRVRWLPFFVAKGAFFLCPDWLRTGYEIWQREGFYFPRDYLLPRPSEDFAAAAYPVRWSRRRPSSSSRGCQSLGGTEGLGGHPQSFPFLQECCLLCSPSIRSATSWSRWRLRLAVHLAREFADAYGRRGKARDPSGHCGGKA